MTPAERFSSQYSEADCELLTSLRNLDPPMPWTQIKAMHFPHRTAAALKMKYTTLCPTGNGRGRPRSRVDGSPFADDNGRFEQMVVRGTNTLGKKIEAWFARMPDDAARACRAYLLTGPQTARRVAA